MQNFELGKKIKDARLNAGFSQEELADKTQLNLRTIQRIENAETIARGDSLKRIASALNITVESLTNVKPLIPEKEKDELEIILLLHLSAFGFLISPFLGLIFSFTLWLIFRNQSAVYHETGKKVIQSQIYWCAIIIVFYLLNLTVSHLESFFQKNARLIFLSLYGYNFLAILLDTMKALWRKRKVVQPIHVP